MNVYTCIIIDDEIQSINLMSIFVDKIKELLCIGTFDSPLKATEFLKKNEVDIIFTDINMPDQLGTEFARCVSQKSQIIFTTAHINYALEAFEIEALDYIVKPITFNRLQKSVTKAIKTLSNSKQTTSEHIFLKKNNTLFRVFLKDILFIKSDDEYVLYTTTEGVFIVKNSLKNTLKELNNPVFVQVHRSYLVNIKLIDQIKSNSICLKENEIPLGRVYKKDVKDLLKNNL